MYACGPTVYDFFHVGNARCFVVFDMLRRYLEFRGYDVTFVQNFTDIDDKVIKKANEEGLTYSDIAKRYIDEYFTDAQGLGVVRATIHPRATHCIDDIIKIIESLIEKGYAYESGGDVFYSTKKFEGYGKLSHLPMDQLESGARIDVNDMKQEVPFEAELCCDICGEPIGDNLLVTLSGSALKTLCSNKCLAQHLHIDEEAFTEVKTSVFYDESQTGYTYPAEVWDEYIIKGKNNILGFVETLPEYTYDAVCVRRPDKTEFLDSLLLGVHKDELKNFTCSKCKSIMHTRYEWDGVLYCQNCLEQEFVAQRGKIVPDLQAPLFCLQTFGVLKHMLSLGVLVLRENWSFQKI
jgi:hypothetical protein